REWLDTALFSPLCENRALAKGCWRPVVTLLIRLLLAVLFVGNVAGCAVVAVADAAVTVAATGVKVAAKTTGAVVDAVIPDDEDDEDADDEDDSGDCDD